jgi:DNA polymerase-1
VIALIDADTMCFASAAMAEGMDEANAIWNVQNQLDALLAAWNIADYQLFVTGPGNFRYQIYPEYKGNRRAERPTHLGACKDYLCREHGAILSIGVEADDLIGIAAYKHLELGDDYTIVSIDKDLDMLEGLHYSPEIRREGKVVKAPRRYHVSPIDAIRFFYYQLLVGDPTDNIKGARGIGKKKAPKILDGLLHEEQMWRAVSEHYSSEEEMILNAKCLWIHRKQDDDVTERWKDYKTTISEI